MCENTRRKKAEHKYIVSFKVRTLIWMLGVSRFTIKLMRLLSVFFLLAKRYVISLLFFFLRNFTLHVKILEEKKVAQSVCENTRRKKARDKILEEKK